MSLLTRRILYSLAILLFLILAPLVVALTAGYRWQGWPTGFIRTGVVVITSQPRAEIRVDGRTYGSTPKKIAGLLPGRVSLELTRDGYQSWEKIVTVSAKTAQLIGPVRLYPDRFVVSVWSADVVPKLAAEQPPTVVGYRPTESGATVNQLWPETDDPPATLTFTPETVQFGPKRQVAVWTGADQQAAQIVNGASVPWLIEPAAQLTWTSQSDYIWFGRRDSTCWRFDAVTTVATVVAACDSLAVSGDELWYTLIDGATTAFYRRSVMTPGEPRLATVLDGRWELLTSRRNDLLIRQPDSRQAELIAYDAITDRLSRRELGRVDRYFWLNDNDPLLWVDGVDLKTLVNGQPRLLERDPVAPIAAQWLAAPDILIMADADQVAIKSVSQKQGRDTLLSAPRLADGVLVIVPDQEIIVLEDNDGQLVTWSWAD